MKTLTPTPGEWTMCRSLYKNETYGFHLTAPKEGSLHPLCAYPIRDSYHKWPAEQIEHNGQIMAAAKELLAYAECMEAWYRWPGAQSMRDVFTRHMWNGTMLPVEFLTMLRTKALQKAGVL